MNVDAFWSRTRLAIQQNNQQVQVSIEFFKLLGIEGPFEYSGPYPFRDHYGYEVASNILLYSRKQWKHTESHNKFETVIKV